MKLSLKGKLFLSFSIALSILITLSCYTFFVINQMNKTNKEMDNVLLHSVDLAHNMEKLAAQYRITECRLTIAHTNQEIAQVQDTLDTIQTNMEKTMTEYENSCSVAAKNLFIDAVSKWNVYLEVHKKLLSLCQQQKYNESVTLMLTESTDKYNIFCNKVGDMVKFNCEQADIILDNSIDMSGNSKSVFLFWLALGILICGCLIAAISRNISRSVKDLLNVTELVSEGDLTQRADIRSHDELGILGEAINHMIEKLQELALNISNSSQNLAASSEQLTASSEESAKATEQIANSTQTAALSAGTQMANAREVYNSITQVSAGLNQIALSSRDMAQLTKMTTQMSKEGESIIQAVVEQMNKINKSVQGTSDVISNLYKKSDEISKIVKLINDITDETNLLSLNAAIEAAKAGEAGIGFSVVADKVRELAKQSKSSANQIYDLVKGIRQEANNAAVSISEGNDRVTEGILKTERVSQSFKDIENAILEVNYKIQEVSSAAQQISAESKKIVKSIENVKNVAERGSQACQENAAASEQQFATMEEIAASAQALSEYAEQLNSLVMHFKVN